jgi:hypothetical protein
MFEVSTVMMSGISFSMVRDPTTSPPTFVARTKSCAAIERGTPYCCSTVKIAASFDDLSMSVPSKQDGDL